MTKRTTKPATAPTTAPAPAKPEPEAVLIPEVSTLPPAVARLTWLERLILADDFLKNPRRFLARCTASEQEIKDDPHQVLPKADHKKIAYSELRAVLNAIAPDSSSAINNRRVQKYFVLNKLGELPVNELQTGMDRLINTLIPYGSGDKAEKDAFGDTEWVSRRKRYWEQTSEVVQEIDSEIRARLIAGERHPDLVVTSDLPNKFLPFHSETDLHWSMERPLRLAGIRYDELAESSPLKKLDPERLPKLTRTGGDAFVILGPSVLFTIQAMPRPYYFLSNVEAFSRLGWHIWSERYQSYLAHRDTDEEYLRFQSHQELIKKPHPKLWEYPASPDVPSLEGFSNRVLFAIDICNHLFKYISKPTTNRTLTELLTARRVLVSELADQDQRSDIYGARDWVGKWYSHSCVESLSEAMASLTTTLMKTVEEMEIAERDARLEKFQREHVFKEEK